MTAALNASIADGHGHASAQNAHRGPPTWVSWLRWRANTRCADRQSIGSANLSAGPVMLHAAGGR
jgi:hypothetical protein